MRNRISQDLLLELVVTSMPPIPPLFVLPVPPTLNAGSSAHGEQGSFICTQAAPQVYLLSFSSPPDNRLVPVFNQTFLLALDVIEHRLPRGVVITTSSITKFYSNGIDFENAIKDPNFFPNSLYPLWRRLITVSRSITYQHLDDASTNNRPVPNADDCIDKWTCLCRWPDDRDDARLSHHEPSQGFCMS